MKPSASKETSNPKAQCTCKFHHAQDTQPSAFRSDKPMVKLLHPPSVTSSCPEARADPSDPPKGEKEAKRETGKTTLPQVEAWGPGGQGGG